MSIIKHEIPLLEYDSNTHGVIMPTHEHLPICLPSKAVYAFLNTSIDEYAALHDARQVATFLSATKSYPVYVISYHGEDICLCQAPVGAASATQIMDWLIGYGVRAIIATGSCGTLQDWEENAWLIPHRALRDEGTSYHYLPPSRYVDIPEHTRRAIRQALDMHSYPYREVITWTTDGFYRETSEKVAYRREEGCAVVEMECSALAACAQLRGALFGQLLFTADTLADTQHYNERNWGVNSHATALEMCFDAASVLRIPNKKE